MKRRVFARADALAAGRYWEKRNGLPRREIVVDEAMTNRLATALTEFYGPLQMRGRFCKVTHYARSGGAEYFFAYLDDYPGKHVMFDDDGRPNLQSGRYAFENVFVYNSNEGTMESYAPGGKKVREPLEALFCEAVLGVKVDPGIRAGQKPMSTYRRKRGERHGHHWYVPNVSRTSELRHVLIDTNFWKSFVHARLATAPGDRGALTLFGKSASEHRLLAEHVAGSETFVRTEGHGRLVCEWSIKPSKPDNHWFDCLVGCAVAASMGGVRFGVERQPEPARPPIKLSELRAVHR